MQALNSLYHLSSVEACSALRKLLVFPKVVKKLSSIEEVHNEVKLCISLEGVVEVDDKRVLNLLQDVPLG